MLSSGEPFGTGRAVLTGRCKYPCEYGTVLQRSWNRKGKSGLGEAIPGCRLPSLAGGWELQRFLDWSGLLVWKGVRQFGIKQW